MHYLYNIYITYFKFQVPTTTPGGGDCFPPSGNVFLENGKLAMISDLQIGDKVQTGIKSHDNVTMSEQPMMTNSHKIKKSVWI